MFNSVEVRVPFLDHRVVEQGLALPGHTKQTLFQTKIPLKQLLREKGFSEDFIEHRKTGFGPSPASWTQYIDDEPTKDEIPDANNGSYDGMIGDILTPHGRESLRTSIYFRLARLWERGSQTAY